MIYRIFDHQYKKSGVSLIMTFGVTFVVMLMAFFLLTALLRTLQRTAHIERSNQIFYAAESGREAGLFHASARGSGVHFCDTTIESASCDLSSVDETLQIEHEGNGITVSWGIHGRAAGFGGRLFENDVLMIPLSWDSATDPTQPITPQKYDIGQGLQVGFYRSVPTSSLFRSKFENGLLPPAFPSGFSFPQDHLFHWQVTHEGGTMVPYATNKNNPCENTSSVCGDNSFPFSNIQWNVAGKQGYILPNVTNISPTTLPVFIGIGNTPTLLFRPVTSYQGNINNNPALIESVPYIVGGTNTPNALLAKPTYRVETLVEGDGFRVEKKSTHRHAVPADHLGYVIFD